MSRKKSIALLLSVTLAATGIVGCQSSANSNLGTTGGQVEQSAVVYEPENTYPVVSNHGSMQTYPDMKSVLNRAELVAAIQIKEQETIQQSQSSVGTRSKAMIQEVFKGDESLKNTTILISEDGGIMDPSKVTGNETRIDPKNPPAETKGMVEIALDGSTVMKQNQRYFVFLRKSGNEENGYNVVGVVQGKIKIGEADRLVATVDPKEMKEQSVKFWIQSQFAGKSKQELVKTIEELK
ncbi:hypothetical protein [Tumebacillus lipolyticus]|uniref:Lipoprotein n=1 Tax=Tumebacillus lipolyticus TaxID=1280370 RepID=A0ABW4ZVL9_9BACL